MQQNVVDMYHGRINNLLLYLQKISARSIRLLNWLERNQAIVYMSLVPLLGPDQDAREAQEEGVSDCEINPSVYLFRYPIVAGIELKNGNPLTWTRLQ